MSQAWSGLVTLLLVVLTVGSSAAAAADEEPAGSRRFVIEAAPYRIGQAPDWVDRNHVVWTAPVERDEDGDGEIQVYRSTLEGNAKVCLTCGLDVPSSPGGFAQETRIGRFED